MTSEQTVVTQTQGAEDELSLLAQPPEVDAQESPISINDILDTAAGQAEAKGVSEKDENAAVVAPVNAEMNTNQSPAAEDEKPIETQRDFNTALGRRLAQERAKNEPALAVYELVMQGTGAKSLDEAKGIIQDLFAERTANQLGTTTEQERARLEDRMRINELERRINQQPATVEPEQDEQRASQQWAQRTMDQVRLIVTRTGDTEFEKAVIEKGSRINQRVLQGDDVARIWFEERGDHAVQSAPYAQTKTAQQPIKTERANGGARTYDMSNLTDVEIERIDAALKRGKRVSVG